jgi:hypothetical protein
MLSKLTRAKQALTLGMKPLNGRGDSCLMLKLNQAALKDDRGGWFFGWPKELNDVILRSAGRSDDSLTQHAKNDILDGEGRKIVGIGHARFSFEGQ